VWPLLVLAVLGLFITEWVRRRMEKRRVSSVPTPAESKGPFGNDEAPPSTTEASPSHPRRAWWKAVVVLLLLVARVVIGSKVLRQRGPTGTGDTGSGRTDRSGRSVRSADFLPEAVVATVGSEEITVRDVDQALRTLPEEAATQYGRQRHEFLEELITRRLLVQEARRLRMKETEAYRAALARVRTGADADESALIDALLRTQVLQGVSVTEADVRNFFAQHRAELPQPATFEDWRTRLEPYARQEKEGEAVQGYVARLRSGVTITRNEDWVEAQRQAAARNPLDEALASGKPVLADFGRGTCIPCKMMKPILDELERELKDRVHVLVLDTGEYGDLATRHGVRVIPTQIFFDASGKERYRHQGFMAKDDIRSKLKELAML
jgi:thioredoxin 1